MMGSPRASQKNETDIKRAIHAHDDADAARPSPYVMKDPVCGMDVDPHAAKHTAEWPLK